MKKPLLTLCTLLLAGGYVHAQSNSQKIDYFSAQNIQKQLSGLASQAHSSGSGGATLVDTPTHQVKLSVRTSSGGAEVHAHYDDVLVITEGQATLITGGTVENPKTGNDGETLGTGISNGNTRSVAKGDVVHIPAGTPHQLKIAPGTLFSTLVVKVREP